MKQNNEIGDCIRKSLDRYFKDLEGEKPRAVSEMLGINRNTLRKKIQSLKIKL